MGRVSSLFLCFSCCKFFVSYYLVFMIKKIDILSELMKSGKWDKAIKFAARFPRLGKERDIILSASSAMLSPQMWQGMGHNIEDLKKQAIDALRSKFPNHC